MVKNRLIPLGDVRSALNTVLSGNSNYGIVYSSDLNIIGTEYDFILIPQEFHSPISYPAAEIKKQDKEIDLCEICFDKKRDHAIVPCGHRVCGPCGNDCNEK